MFRKALAVAAVAVSAWVPASVNTAKAETIITGTGTTFPMPVYTRWAEDYSKDTGVKLNYQSIGSGGGIKQIKAKTVDFGASNAPLKAAELDEAGLVQFPAIMGGIVPVVNIPGVKPGQLKLSSDALAKIFMGSISNWNDPAIKALNSGLALPDKTITVVTRADGSGTTWVYTTYLSSISKDFKEKVGADKAVKWPGSNTVSGKGNESVAGMVKQVEGSIGYVESAYASQNKMTYTLLQNKDGAYPEPGNASFQAAAANADWAGSPGFYVVLVNQPGKESWPITGASFILMHKKQADGAHAAEVLKFFNWCFEKGDKAATSLDYVPMPDSVVKLVKETWGKSIADEAGKPLWTAK